MQTDLGELCSEYDDLLLKEGRTDADQRRIEIIESIVLQRWGFFVSDVLTEVE